MTIKTYRVQIEQRGPYRLRIDVLDKQHDLALHKLFVVDLLCIWNAVPIKILHCIQPFLFSQTFKLVP